MKKILFINFIQRKSFLVNEDEKYRLSYNYYLYQHLSFYKYDSTTNQSTVTSFNENTRLLK